MGTVEVLLGLCLLLIKYHTAEDSVHLCELHAENPTLIVYFPE